jgi:alpha-galactosidase
MVLSVCEWGRDHPWEWAGPVGHLWRTCWDIQDTWESLRGIVDRQRDLEGYAGPDHWNDPDMLEIGNGGMTLDEYRAHFSMWCVLAAPLMAGNDVRDMPADVAAILTAPEPIAVDQDPLGSQGRFAREVDGGQIWVRDLSDGSAAVLLNTSEEPRELAIRWEDLGWDPRTRVAARDLWERADLGTTREGRPVKVAAHGAVMLKLRPESS